MSKGPHSFDSAVQTANAWLKAIDDRLLSEDRAAACEALRAVLHALRDRLPLEAVLGLSAQCPLLVRGVLLEGWRPQDGPSAIRTPVAFCDAVAAQLPPSFAFSGREATEAVFGVLSERLDGGEVRKIVRHLPEPLRVLWPAPSAVGVAVDAPPRRTAPTREARRRAHLRWGLLAGAALTAAGGALIWALIVSPAQSGAPDPARILLDPTLGLHRLAAGLLFAGLVILLGSGLAAVLLGRPRA